MKAQYDPSSMSPESMMMSHGYKPEWSEGSLKCPIFQTSTYVFEKAEDGKAFFEVAYGLREPESEESPGLIYSRLNNPNLEIFEKRLCLWDGAEDCAVFQSGMSGISTVLMEFLNPGDVLLYSNPVYGGTAHFISHLITRSGVEVIPFGCCCDKEDLLKKLKDAGKLDSLKMIYIETPANPTNCLIDIEACSALAKELSTEEKKIYLVVDNTYLGPVFQHPLKFGADLVLYSATKYIGGHSDLIAGAVLGSKELMARVKTLRAFLGNMSGPWTSWLLMRSLETLKLRMVQQAENAKKVADFLNSHPKVKKVYYLGLLTEEESPKQYAIFKRQCNGSGAMVSFDIKGGESEAFTFLNCLGLVKLAVSLGGTESLGQHPSSMTHAGLSMEEKQLFGITDSLIRLSIGIEDYQDLLKDIGQALDQVQI